MFYTLIASTFKAGAATDAHTGAFILRENDPQSEEFISKECSTACSDLRLD